jgi:hypothetical protein
VIGSFLAAALGWVVLEFIARPLRKFYDLRGEVAVTRFWRNGSLDLCCGNGVGAPHLCGRAVTL